MNPEFVRNLWLELSPRRLIWTAVALTLLYAVALSVSAHTQSATWSDGRWVRTGFPAFAACGAVVFLVAGLLWGVRAATRGLNDEVLGRTWAFQRASSLSAWEMTWGKLFGASSLAWLVALSGLGVMALSTWRWQGPRTAAAVVLFAASIAVLVQALGFASVLAAVRKARAEVRLYTGRVGLLGAVVGLLALAWLLVQIGPLRASLQVHGGSVVISTHVDWWGLHLSSLWFTVGSAMLFAALAVAAAWRLMRLELQMRNSAWPWAAFVLWAGVYVAGFAGRAQDRFVFAAIVFAGLAYASAFVDPADRVRLKLWAGAVRGLDLREASIGAPALIVPLKLALLAMIGAALAPTGSELSQLAASAMHPRLFLFAAYAFLLRDLGVITFFRFTPRAGGRGDLPALVALALIYLIGQALARALGGPSAQALLRPVSGHEMQSLWAGLGEAAVAVGLAAMRVRAVQRRP